LLFVNKDLFMMQKRPSLFFRNLKATNKNVSTGLSPAGLP
jgi:hypothetical protein